MSHYYTAVEKFLAEHQEIKFTPRLIDFEKIEATARDALANNLSYYRKSVNLPQAKMGKIFGISLSQYKKYELGEEVLRIDLAQKWSLRFSMPVFHLLQGSGYAEGLTISVDESRLHFLWFLANTLTDAHFSKLVEMLCLFTNHRFDTLELAPSRVMREDLNKVIKELDDSMFVAIAYGLQAARKRFQFSQETIAELLGVSISTYQQYEKPTMKPRFSVFVAARYGMATGIPPLAILAGTQFAKVRHMQDERMAVIREIVKDVEPERLKQLKPLIDGFSGMVKRIPGALIVDV